MLNALRYPIRASAKYLNVRAKGDKGDRKQEKKEARGEGAKKHGKARAAGAQNNEKAKGAVGTVSESG
eukprot:1143992-Pelagomonas_calceolata.AAC.1